MAVSVTMYVPIIATIPLTRMNTTTAEVTPLWDAIRTRAIPQMNEKARVSI
jgi:hypothetical protein